MDLKETTSDPIIEEAMAAPKSLRTVKIAEEEEWDEATSVARNESEKCCWVL